MKHTFITLIMLICFVFGAEAQSSIVLKKEIQWTGLETWSTDTVSKQVLAFVNSQYPSYDDLPYFTHRLEQDGNSDYSVTVVNPVFEQASGEETAYLSDKNLPEAIAVSSYVTHHWETQYYNIQVLPLIRIENKVLKLVSFELHIDKHAVPQKARAAFHSYAESSVLASGKFVKVSIKETGIYKLTYENLKSMGIDPANVRVFGYGGALLKQDFSRFKPDDLPEVAVWMEKGSDGVFNEGDYILFYGQGLTKWEYNSANKIFTHTLNHYANESYYFITSDAGSGKRVQDKVISVPPGANIVSVEEFADYQGHEQEKINIGKTGQVFYGEEFNSTLSYSFPFTFPNPVNASITVRIDVAAISSDNSNFTLKLNEQPKNIPVSMLGTGKYDVAKSNNMTFTFTSPGTSAHNFTLTYSKPNNASRGYLNYLEVNVRRRLHMDGSAMFFRNTDNLNTDKYNKYRLTGANQNVQIWDVTDPANIHSIAVTRTGDVLEFTDSNEGVKQYLAIDPTSKNSFTMEPVSVGNVANQNLHGLPAAEMIIITHPDFVSQAERLAQAHRDMDGMSVHVVTTGQVYNEFSSGTPDGTAYRWVMKMFYDRAKEAGDKNLAPKYLLLFGRGTYDNRGLIPNSGDNLILTYQAETSLNLVESYVTDDYFGLLDDSEGIDVRGEIVDIGIGRFPTVTVQHAEDVVNKTIEYMKDGVKGNWKNQLSFVADDGDGSLHVKDADDIATKLSNSFPKYQVQKIYLDSYKQERGASGESYPLAREKLLGLINTGILMLNYTGHAGFTGWTNELILTTNDIRNMYNKRLPIWIGATCNFVLFDVKAISAGEHVLLNPIGGGIAVLSAARTVYASQNKILNEDFTLKLFQKKDGKYPRLGEALQEAKNGIRKETNKLSYTLLGDPALRLNYPDDYDIVTETINENPVQSTDTLRALSVYTVKSSVIDTNGNKASDFNGTAEITVFDKIQSITTLNNHNEAEDKGYFTFQDRSNILYSGKADISQGEFTYTFMVPKDIRYNYGTGRINYYVSDSQSGADGQGYYESFIVGGSNSGFEYEVDGPIIEMYLNTPSFKSGGKVNETPLLVANISDINGINTTGSGIGHDLKLIIDNNPQTTYTLNEYFEAEAGTYQSGSLRVKLPAMSAGKHTLTLYVWDLLNNSSQATLEFEVVPGLAPMIFSVKSYPNPVRTETTFIVEHDRPEMILDATIDIFDLNGRLIFTKHENNTDNLKWNLEDSNGNRVQPGVYMYRISLKTPNSELISNANKIIVTKQ